MYIHMYILYILTYIRTYVILFENETFHVNIRQDFRRGIDMYTLFNPADTMFLTRIVTIDHAIKLLAEFNSDRDSTERASLHLKY